MDINNIIRVCQRRIWLVVSVVLVTALAIGLRLLLTREMYAAQVKLQITAPQQEDVTLYERYRALDARDELTVTRNNFTEVLQSRETMRRTAEQFGLSGENADYKLAVSPIRDADFIYISVSAHDPQLAADIANAHVRAAITYYGEIRARPTAATKDMLAGQLRTAEEQLQRAEADLTEFRVKYGITTMDGEVAIYQSLIDKLQTERNQRLIEGPTNWEIQKTEAIIEQLSIDQERAVAEDNGPAAQNLIQSIARLHDQLEALRDNTSATANVDQIIEGRRREVADLLLLQPTYNRLAAAVEQANKHRELLLGKYTEALLKESTVKAVNYIQPLEPAIAPQHPVATGGAALLTLALVGSLGVGIMLAIGVEYLENFAWAGPLLTIRAPIKSRPRTYPERQNGVEDPWKHQPHAAATPASSDREDGQ